MRSGSKSTKCLSNKLLNNTSNIYAILSNQKRFQSPTFINKSSLQGLGKSRSTNTQSPQSAVERELLGLERDEHIDISKDPRTEADFPEIRVKGPRSQNKDYVSKTQKSSKQNVFNRPFIEKKHAEYGWSPFAEKTASQWNWKDNARPFHKISDSEKENWPNELSLIEDGQSQNKNYNANDLTTFESFSESSRSATFKAALNVGVHWGKEKSKWNVSMAPYLKGVVNGRHIFDLSLTIMNLRKMIRLLQSLIMDECNILFVCNSNKDVEMKTLAKIMCTRINMPLLDDKFTPGALSNWNHMSEHFRGPGKQFLDGNKPCRRKWKKTKLHRMMQEPPDFIFLFNRSYNDILVHEANRIQIPVASLCDSDDSTRDLQYVIPCNTESIQSVHFVLDMLTRGILEAQSKMDSVWWSKQKDFERDRNAMHDAEVEWEFKYDPYEQQRHAGRMMAGDADDSLDIATNYIKADEDIVETIENQTVMNKNIMIGKHGNVVAGDRGQKNMTDGDVGDWSEGALDPIEQSRQEKLKSVMDNRSTAYDRKYSEKRKEALSDDEKYVKDFELPRRFQSASDFAMEALREYTTNQEKQRQRLDSMTSASKKM